MNRGTYVEIDQRPAVQFAREYPSSIADVWDAVTAPEELNQWFPSKVEYEPHVGGTVTFTGDPNLPTTHGTVLAFDPPKHFAFQWGDDELWFALEPINDSTTRFTLTNFLGETDTAARNATGWHVCMGELDKLMSGETPDGPHSDAVEPFAPLYESYKNNGFPSGAPIPKSNED